MATTPDDIDLKLEFDGRSTDWFLQDLIEWANGGLEFGITLTVDGSTISGVLIGGKRYFELFADTFLKAWPEGEAKQEMQRLLEGHASEYDKGKETATSPQYVHLRDARTFEVAGAIPTNAGTLWRGRVNAVSGWSIGQLSNSGSKA